MKLVELHVLQTVAPCNLNRDDTNSPKDAMFGGVRRARISSQAQKRAARLALRQVLPNEDLAVRTMRLAEAVQKHLPNRPPDQVEPALAAALNAIGLGLKGGRTEYLLFLGQREVQGLAAAIDTHFDELVSSETKGKSKVKVSGEVKEALERVLRGGKAADLALFGRMLADRPELGVDAAVQVAHAISTHRVDREFDYYTAVDDLNPKEEPGAGMIGDVEFYSATLYRYAVLDAQQLYDNLQGDRDLATQGALAFLRAFALTLPSGKQNSFAAHNPPLFVGLRAGEGLPRNLATAFERPVWASDGKSIAALSVERLLAEWEKFDRAFGVLDPEWVALLNLADADLPYHRNRALTQFDDVLALADEALEALLPKEA